MTTHDDDPSTGVVNAWAIAALCMKYGVTLVAACDEWRVLDDEGDHIATYKRTGDDGADVLLIAEHLRLATAAIQAVLFEGAAEA
jgi:hypothetical protein